MTLLKEITLVVDGRTWKIHTGIKYPLVLNIIDKGLLNNNELFFNFWRSALPPLQRTRHWTVIIHAHLKRYNLVDGMHKGLVSLRALIAFINMKLTLLDYARITKFFAVIFD